MFELPEYVTLAGQINETLTGKTIRKGSLGNTPHKFVWYNRSHAEFERLTQGKTVGEARAKGKWLFIYIRLMDNKAVGHPCPECGTKIEKIQYLGGACYFCPRCQQ